MVSHFGDDHTQVNYKDAWKRGNNVAETFFRKQMFPRLRLQETFLAGAKFASREARMFLNLFRNILLSQQMFSRLRAPYSFFKPLNNFICSHTGCEINNIFRRVDETEPLRVISKNRWRRTELNKEECYISPDISWYIGCDGKRETLKPDQTSFKLRWNTGNPQAYFLTVRLS